MAPTDLSLLEGAPLEVAPRLLGAVIRHGDVAVRITEVEAYDGADDPGSHAYRGRTARNGVMFGEPGHLYAYFIYGMWVCANVVCRPAGTAGAVLLRAGEVVDGLEVARERRPHGPEHQLASGPARLCTVLGINRDHDGVDLRGGPVRLELDPEAAAPPGEVASGPRVGLRRAAEWPWRFWIRDDRTVSAYRPAAPLRSRRREDAE